MKINKTMAIVVILLGLLLGGLGAGVFLSQRPLSVNAAPPAQSGDDTDEVGEVEDDEDDDTNEVDDADEAGEVEDHEAEEVVSPDQAGITADQAQAAAEAAHAGAKAIAVELERENGQVIYEVELNNGLEVIIDAANGDILGTEQEDAD